MKFEVYCKTVETKKENMCFVFSSEYTSYTYVVNTSSDTWELQKRFSNFVDLDDMLHRKFSDQMIKVPPLPEKRTIGALSPSLIKERRKSLESYLKAVLANRVIAQSEEISQWLEVPQEAAISDEEDDGWSRSSGEQ